MRISVAALMDDPPPSVTVIAEATVSGRADAAERIGVEPEPAPLVDPQRADLELFGDAERGLEALGKTRALQAELRVVGDAESIVEIRGRNDDGDRPERFLAQEQRIVGWVDHDRGTEDCASALGHQGQTRALGKGVIDEALHPVGGRGADHGADRGILIVGPADF